jgi:hypothetical protein
MIFSLSQFSSKIVYSEYMWHLKTKSGVFWVIPVADSASKAKHPKYLLGINDRDLAFYTDAEQAAHDVYDQRTGFLKWDMQRQVDAPNHIKDWAEGEPQAWHHH